MSRTRGRSPGVPDDQSICVVNRIENFAPDLQLRLLAPPRHQPILQADERLRIQVSDESDNRQIRRVPVAVVRPRVPSEESDESLDSDVDELLEWVADYARSRQGFHHLHPI